MALGANTIFDVRTTGSDSLNSGCFDPGQTAGMLTDGAATSATGASPVFTSASYNFVAGDVGVWLYISSGTNWTPGWYQIASVSSNAATISAALGAYYIAVNKNPVRLSTNNSGSGGLYTDAAGCATTASPTGATWSIDYSQQNAAQFSYTDLASVGAGLLVSSVAFPFGKQQVGNGLIIASGTNFAAGVYVIASVGALNVATVVGAGNITTGAGVSGVGGLGGAFATPGKAASVKIAGNDILWKSGTYNLSGNTVNTAACQVIDTTGGVDQTNVCWWVGWNTNRSIHNTDVTWPVLNANAQTSLTLFSMTGSYTRARNIVVDGNSKSSMTGLNFNAGYSKLDHAKAQNCTVIGLDIAFGNSSASAWFCSATGCSGTAGIRVGNTSTGTVYFCESYANTIHGFVGSVGIKYFGCLSYLNTSTGAAGGGGSIDGFNQTSVGSGYLGCVAYGNGRNGFLTSSSVGCSNYINSISESNGGSGWDTGAVRGLVSLVNCGGYNNTSGNFTASNITDVLNFIVGSASFFTNAAIGDFSLATTSPARAAGYPGLMPRGLTTGYADVGAAQHADPAVITMPRITGG